MASELVSVRLDAEIKDRLEALAQATGRSRNALFNEAMAQYVDAQEAAVSALHEGVADLDAGRVVPHEDVVHQLISRGYMTKEGYAQALAELDKGFPLRRSS
jgi:predicted transcriptional regulator